MTSSSRYPARLLHAERLTLAVLLSGIASLALSDFVSPFYWGMVAVVSALRLWRGPGFCLTEMQASMIGWAGFIWVGLELFLGRAWVVAFTDFLLILSLAIVIEEATARNHLHRMLVGFFLILGAAVLTDSVLYIIPLAAFIWFVWRASQCLYGMQLAGGDLPMTPWRSDLRWFAGMAAVTALLFVMLPRFDFHSYLKPVQPRMQTSGFSSKVQMGDFARSLDATVVLRIESLDENVAGFRRQLMGRYWRGTALGVYVGNGWEAVAEKPVVRWQAGADANFTGQNSRLQFAVYREASDHAYVFVPDDLSRIAQLPAAMQLGEQGSLRFETAPQRRLRMVIQLGKRGSGAGADYLRPPVAQEREQVTVPGVVRSWASKTAGDAAEAKDKLARLVAELKGWDYDLNATIDSAAPVASFMAIKRGHCELYATTLALAARSLGIPARVVNGYFGGEWNDVGGFYLLRQQHAHSWVEAWVDGAWQRFDATPASRWQLSGVRFPALDEVWESVKLSWYRYVLEFQNSDRSQTIQSLLTLFKTYAIWVVGMLAGFAGLLLLKRSGIRLPRWRLTVDRIALVDRWLAKRGVQRKPHQPLRHLPLPRNVSEVQWREFVRAWEHQLYGQTVAGKEQWSRRSLKRHLRALC